MFALVALVAACSTADLTNASVNPTTSGGPGSSGEVGPGGGADGGPGEDPGTPLAMTSAVTIQVQPSDKGAALLAAVRDAKKSVRMTIYLLTSREMIDALGDVKQAGKDVKVILNKSFPTSDNANQDAYDKLQAKGVDVVWASSAFTFTHSKTIVIDSEKAIISTMNLTYTSPTSNREYIATDTDPQDVADLEKIFEADFTGKLAKLESKLVISPEGANTLHAPRAQLTRLIGSAQSSVEIEAESLSDTGIVDALVAAHDRKVEVRVVLDPTTLNSKAQEDALAKLKEHGVPVRGVSVPDIHSKAIVVDRARAFVGSQNFTVTALEANREIGVLTDAASEVEKVSDVIRGDFDGGTDL